MQLTNFRQTRRQKGTADRQHAVDRRTDRQRNIDSEAKSVHQAPIVMLGDQRRCGINMLVQCFPVWSLPGIYAIRPAGVCLLCKIHDNSLLKTTPKCSGISINVSCNCARRITAYIHPAKPSKTSKIQFQMNHAPHLGQTTRILKSLYGKHPWVFYSLMERTVRLWILGSDLTKNHLPLHIVLR
jgi:hypothetical protein